jgi:DNA mismatch repair protein MutS
MEKKEKADKSKDTSSAVTPLMQQYFLIKERYPEELVFFQVGDFYELFFTDAQVAAKILGITLTKRGQHDGKDIPLCGVPVHMIEHYYPKLLKNHHTVVICDQVEVAQPGKLVSRAVTDIITPSTLCTAEATDTSFSLYVVRKDNCFYCFWFEFLQQKISYASYQGDDAGILLLKAALKKYVPQEVIVKKDQFEFFWQFLDKKYKIKSFQISIVEVEKQLKAYQLSVLFTEIMQLFISYMTLYFQNILDKKNIFFEEEKSQSFLFLDESTTTYLELTENLSNQEKTGTLFEFLDQTETKMGSRLLRSWILYPLRNKIDIEKRQENIELFLKNKFTFSDLRHFLGSFGDIERLFQRTRLKKIHDREYTKFIEFKKNYYLFLSFISSRASYLKEFLVLIPDLFFESIDQYLNGNDMILIENEKAVINPYATEKLAYYYTIVTDQKKILTEFVEKEKKRTSIDDLVIKSTPLYGYTFELSKIKEKQYSLPSYFVRVQTLTNRERYTSPELQQLSYDLTDALFHYRNEEKIAKELFIEDCILFQSFLLSFASSVAMIDIYLGLAEVSSLGEWVKPFIHLAHEALVIKDGKHPLFSLKNNFFVANTLSLSDKKTLLLTGPNMGGKSTFMRQNALIIILAHMGSFVPAAFAEIPLMENIFTRIGASDSIETGKSTFFVELEEINRIISFANQASFVIIDEIGRGTSTYDGIALAASIIQFLLDEKKPYMICSTHYHELFDLIDSSSVLWAYMGYHMTKEQIQFLYALLPGVAQNSMGIALAEKIGLPKIITAQARFYFNNLENKKFLISEKKEEEEIDF